LRGVWICTCVSRIEEGKEGKVNKGKRKREKKGTSPVQYDQEEAESSPKYHF
jgi:hypothetical protein